MQPLQVLMLWGLCALMAGSAPGPLGIPHETSNRYGPFRTETGVPLPKHARSPFAERKETGPPLKEKDYVRDRVVFKLAAPDSPRLRGLAGTRTEERLLM